jgi:hypothetical protein
VLICFANGNRSGQDGKFSVIGKGEDNTYPDPSPPQGIQPNSYKRAAAAIPTMGKDNIGP